VPEALKEWPSARRNRATAYPYDTLFNGRVWRFVQGIDYHCQTTTALSALYREARHRGILLVATVQKNKTSIVLQAMGDKP
jgi:hypothetical protein